MKIRPHDTMTFSLAAIALAVLVAAGGAFAGHGHEEKGGHGHEEKGTVGHGNEEHGEEKSDLDRPVAEMWKAKCEHGILQYSCDECRFEVGTVKLSPELISGKGKPGLVAIGKAGGRTVPESRTFTGEVKLSEGKTAHVSAPLPGVIREVFADIGSSVKEGDPLFEVDSHDVAEAKGDYLKKRSARDLAKASAEREAMLFEKKISAQVEVQQAKAQLEAAEVEASNARGRLLRLGIPAREVESLDPKNPDSMAGLLTVRAPGSGSVLERHVSRGERVDAGKDLLLISDLSEVWVWADLRESDIRSVFGRINGGAKLAAEVSSLSGGKPYRGTLDVVSGTMNEPTRTVKARIVVANPEGRLRPGMFVTVRVFLSGEGSVLAVPKAAVLADEGRPFVFVHKEGDYWIRRPVTLGKRLGDMVEIRSGLAAGQRIVTDGSFLLKSDVLRRKMGAGCAD